MASMPDIGRTLTCGYRFRRTGRTRSIDLRIRSPAALANLVPLVVERKILVDGSLANRLNAVEPRVALIARLEARRDVDRRWELQSLRAIRCSFAVVLHEDDRAVIGAKRRPDVKCCRSVRTDEDPVRDCGSRQLRAQAVSFN